MKTLDLRACLLGCASALILAQAAHSQAGDATDEQAIATAPAAAEDADRRRLQTVVVTAQKREQDAQDIGIAVAAFGEEQIRSLGIKSADNVADSISGVQVYHYRGKGQPSFVVRGVGTQDFAPNTAPTAAVYLDDVYLGSNIVSGFQIFDVSRVELLKGPQGTLFGRNTTGGAVSYASSKPTDEFEGYAELGYANYDTTTANFAVSGPVADGVRMRFAAKFSDQGEGHIKNVFVPSDDPFSATPNYVNRDSKIGEDRTWAARFLTEIDLSESGTLFLNAHGGKRESDTLPVTPIGFTQIVGAAGACAATPTGGGASDPRFCGDAFGYSDTDGDEFTVNNDFVGRNEEENVGGSARLRWDFGPVAFTSISAFEHATKVQSADADGSPLSVFANTTDVYLDQYSQEFRLASDAIDNIYWIAGVYFSHDKIKQEFCGDLNPLLGLGVACKNNFSQSTDNAAVFGQLEYRLTEKLRLTTGLRYTDETRDFMSINTLTDAMGNVAIANFGTGPEDAAIVDDSVSSGNLSGKIGLDYFLTDDILLYASYSNGYKSGGYDGDFSFDRQQLNPYREETIGAYEIGWKTTLADGTLRFNGAAFYYDYSDPQMRVQRISSGGLPFNQLINLSSAVVRGIESDVVWTATDKLDITASVTLLDTEINEDDPDPALALFDGNEFALAASESFTLMARYAQPVSERLTATFQVDGKYNGPFELNAENLPWLRQDSYVLVNARVSLLDEIAGWELSAWGQNMTDEVFASGSYSLFGAFPVAYNTSRSYGISLRYDW